MLKRYAIRLVLTGCLAGCGAPPPSPGEIAEGYITAVAEGNYANACALLDGHTRRALQAAMRSTAGCATLLARCLPTKATVLERDQTQLLYSNITSSVHGKRATVRTSGTAVARAIGEVTLVNDHGRWALTSYGKERCPPAGRVLARAGRSRR